jgi:DNA modification methylase
MTIAHPAKYSSVILERLDKLLAARIGDSGQVPLVLDPFAGTGKIHQLNGIRSVGVEIEPEWATMHPHTVVGNTLHLPFRTGSFDGMITSPTYGNRHADHHNARDGSFRHSYTHTLGRTLHADNSGTLHWGDDYRAFHDQAWSECLRTQKPGAFVMLNVSNHIRNKTEQPVVEWHLAWFLSHHCKFVELEHVDTPRLRAGANSTARVAHEFIIHFTYTPQETTSWPREQSGVPSSRTAPVAPG